MRKTLFLFVGALLLASCHESIEERARREAADYTRRNCPTPYINDTRTDSIVFDDATHTYTYYCSVRGMIDDAAFVNEHKGEMTSQLAANLRQDTNMRVYKEAGFNFAYVVTSTKDKGKVLYLVKFTPKDYE